MTCRDKLTRGLEFARALGLPGLIAEWETELRRWDADALARELDATLDADADYEEAW